MMLHVKYCSVNILHTLPQMSPRNVIIVFEMCFATHLKGNILTLLICLRTIPSFLLISQIHKKYFNVCDELILTNCSIKFHIIVMTQYYSFVAFVGTKATSRFFTVMGLRCLLQEGMTQFPMGCHWKYHIRTDTTLL